MIIIQLLLIVLSNAATEHLPRGLKLKYYFPSEESVTFEFWVPFKTITYYDWVGLGLQDSRDPIEDFRCDYYTALVEGGVFTDGFSNQDGVSNTDEELGGTNDIETYRLTKEDHDIFVLTRKLDTQDTFDIVIPKGLSLQVKWVLGNIDENQNKLIQNTDDQGFEYAVLLEEYEDRNSDERGTYGPWTVHFYKDFKQMVGGEDWSIYLEELYGRPDDISDEYASDD